jgi:hypothetical protein
MICIFIFSLLADKTAENRHRSQFHIKRHKSEYMYFVWNTRISNVLSAVLYISLALVLMEILSHDN